MADHRQARELLSPYRDGELDDASRAAVADHVARCEECKTELATWEAIGSALFRRPLDTLLPGFSSRVMSRLPDQPVPAFDSLRGSFRRWLVPSFGAALAILALAVTIPEPETSDPTEILLLADGDGSSEPDLAWLGQPGATGSLIEYSEEEP